MSETSSVLLTSGTMGPAEWTEVVQRLTSSGSKLVVDADLVYDRGMGAAAGTQLERLRQNAFWTSSGVSHVDVAVGFDIGAGPAAAMVSCGRATSAVLIDPDVTTLAKAHTRDLDVFVPDDADLELALEISERLGPFSENLKYGPLTREMVEILCGSFTGDRWRAKQAELVAPFLMNDILVDRSSLPTEDDLRASDWAASATGSEAVQVWLSAGRDRLAEYLRSRGFNVSVTSWGRGPWLESPDELAAAIKREVVLARQLP